MPRDADDIYCAFMPMNAAAVMLPLTPCRRRRRRKRRQLPRAAAMPLTMTRDAAATAAAKIKRY